MSDDQQPDEPENVDDSDSPLTEQPTLPSQKASDAPIDETTLPPRNSSSATGREMLALKGHSRTVWSVRFSPDGKRIVSGSRDNKVKVWDARPLEKSK